MSMRGFVSFIIIFISIIIPRFTFASTDTISVKYDHKKAALGSIAKITFYLPKKSDSIYWLRKTDAENYVVLAEKSTDTTINNVIYASYQLWLTSIDPGDLMIQNVAAIRTHRKLADTVLAPMFALEFLPEKRIDSLAPLKDFNHSSKTELLLLTLKLIALAVVLSVPLLLWVKRYTWAKPQAHHQVWAIEELNALMLQSKSAGDRRDYGTSAFQVLKKFLIYNGFSISLNDSEEYVIKKMLPDTNEDVISKLSEILTESVAFRFSSNQQEINSFLLKISDFIAGFNSALILSNRDA